MFTAFDSVFSLWHPLGVQELVVSSKRPVVFIGILLSTSSTFCFYLSEFGYLVSEYMYWGLIGRLVSTTALQCESVASAAVSPLALQSITALLAILIVSVVNQSKRILSITNYFHKSFPLGTFNVPLNFILFSLLLFLVLRWALIVLFIGKGITMNSFLIDIYIYTSFW